MESQPLVLLTKENLLTMVEASVGSPLFRHLYAMRDGETSDLLRDGRESCAYFNSVILHTFKLIESPHATVCGLIRDLEASGWQKLENSEPPEKGDVLIWEAIKQVSDELHQHCGFYMGNDEAVSNDYREPVRAPARHHFTYGVKDGSMPARAITAIYRHPSFM